MLAGDDDALTATTRQELADLLGITATPVLTRVHRWPRGYPQYDVGHLGTVAAAETQAPPGLILAGSAYYGVGLPDCVHSGRRAASRVRDLLATTGPPAYATTNADS